jgi:hypothetical protein
MLSRGVLVAKLGLLIAACAALFATPAQAVPGDVTALGVGPNANTLYRFASVSPGIVASVPVTGLAVGATLVGLDYRPSTAQLYGLARNGDVASVYSIDPITGVATLTGSATVSGIGAASSFDVDFNPVVDRLRVVDDLAHNFRLTPSGTLAGTDTPLIFSDLPGGAGDGPEVGVAYDRSLGTAATTLFGIVSGGDRLVRQGGVDGIPSANGGTLTNIGLLGVNTSPNAGLDIDGAVGKAYAVLEVGGFSGLYQVNLTSGAATLVGTIGTGLVDFGSLAIEQSPAPPVVTLPASVAELGLLALKPKSFRAAGKGGAIAGAAGKKAPVGTSVTYSLSIAATAEFSVERLTSGRKVGKKCRKKTRGNRKHKACTLVTPVKKSSFSHSGAAGENRFTFTGRVNNRALNSGTYNLVASVGASVKRAKFKIVP